MKKKYYYDSTDFRLILGDSLKELKKIDTSKNISSEGYQFNCDNYNIVQLLGEGTFGKIYLVEDPDDLNKYALKKISVSDMEELNDNKKICLHI